jgi:hypothetical protein
MTESVAVLPRFKNNDPPILDKPQVTEVVSPVPQKSFTSFLADYWLYIVVFVTLVILVIGLIYYLQLPVTSTVHQMQPPQNTSAPITTTNDTPQNNVVPSNIAPQSSTLTSAPVQGGDHVNKENLRDILAQTKVAQQDILVYISVPDEELKDLMESDGVHIEEVTDEPKTQE